MAPTWDVPVLFTFTSTIPNTPTNTENYPSPNDPNFTNKMVSHYDYEKQHTYSLTYNTLMLKPR